MKMVHSRNEYGDMQLICEAYHLMKDVLAMAQDETVQAFEDWNKTELDLFLIEITANILKFQDADSRHLLPKIRDSKGQKGTGNKKLKGPQKFQFDDDKKSFLEDIQKALYASEIISYAQGFMLLRQAATKFGWTLNYGGITLMWRGSCIIRSVFLGKIKDVFD
ncbi:hypothetical protein P7K49_015948 [Saguinus oedipus]|uniref:phosphogluconate dehydrogenase (NADP(+)-dependent, decarboxylating) n=1 Tax=Saguinus oedipus TaxID=9490 RepID=A0ABQ9VBZ8_SAGOE|nr:hypothetical protein P7K49_015948 [Saguinus oedipus]